MSEYILNEQVQRFMTNRGFRPYQYHARYAMRYERQDRGYSISSQPPEHIKPSMLNWYRFYEADLAGMTHRFHIVVTFEINTHGGVTAMIVSAANPLNLTAQKYLWLRVNAGNKAIAYFYHYIQTFMNTQLLMQPLKGREKEVAALAAANLNLNENTN